MLSRPLEIMWIIVPSSHNDEVLEASGQKQLSVVQKSQVAGPQIAALSGVGKSCLKRDLCLFRFVPVSGSDPGSSQPYLADSIRWTFQSSGRIHDCDVSRFERFPTSHQRPSSAFRGSRLCHDCMSQRVRVHRQNRRSTSGRLHRHKQRGFSKPIGRRKTCGRESP